MSDSKVAVSLHELESALEIVELGGRNEAFISRSTGKVFCRFDDYSLSDEFPDDFEESDDYLAIPNRRDLDLSRNLVLAFAREHMPTDYDDVRAIFSRAGAYRRFDGLLTARRKVEKWYAFEAAATKSALKAWCADHDIEVTDDPP